MLVTNHSEPDLCNAIPPASRQRAVARRSHDAPRPSWNFGRSGGKPLAPAAIFFFYLYFFASLSECGVSLFSDVALTRLAVTTLRFRGRRNLRAAEGHLEARGIRYPPCTHYLDSASTRRRSARGNAQLRSYKQSCMAMRVDWSC